MKGHCRIEKNSFPVTASGLQILLHGVISLTDATSYDKCMFNLE